MKLGNKTDRAGMPRIAKRDATKNSTAGTTPAVVALLSFVFFLSLLISVHPWFQTAVQAAPRHASVLTGIDVLEAQKFAPLAGKRVGLITNQTGVDRNRRSTIDLLARAPGVKLVSLFSPEHGIRGAVAKCPAAGCIRSVMGDSGLANPRRSSRRDMRLFSWGAISDGWLSGGATFV